MQVNGCPNNAARSRAAAINAPCCEQRQSVRSSVAEIADSASRSAAPKLAMHQRKEMRRAARSRVPDASHDSHVTTKTRRATPRNPRRPVCQKPAAPAATPCQAATGARTPSTHCLRSRRSAGGSHSARRRRLIEQPTANSLPPPKRAAQRTLPTSCQSGDHNHGLHAPRETKTPGPAAGRRR